MAVIKSYAQPDIFVTARLGVSWGAGCAGVVLFHEAEGIADAWNHFFPCQHGR